MDFKRIARRSGRSDTLEHSIAQIASTLVIMFALAPASPTIACLWLIAIAIARGAPPNV